MLVFTIHGLHRSQRLWLALWMGMVVAVGACRPGPGAVVESGEAEMVTVTFTIGSTPHEYVGFGTADMTISSDDLHRIGTASSADAALFPDQSVYALAGVNPADAIVLLDRSVDPHGDAVLFTRDGVSPPQVPGVCSYYSLPEEFACASPT
jgi:hypothetical protein